jgi:hypothetical protein
MLRHLLAGLALVVLAAQNLTAEQRPIAAGFAAVEITPDLAGEKPVYMAGYGMNRKAQGVHDSLFARAVVLADGEEKVAVVSVDLVGLQYPEVKAIRAKLPQRQAATIQIRARHQHAQSRRSRRNRYLGPRAVSPRRQRGLSRLRRGTGCNLRPAGGRANRASDRGLWHGRG